MEEFDPSKLTWPDPLKMHFEFRKNRRKRIRAICEELKKELAKQGITLKIISIEETKLS